MKCLEITILTTTAASEIAADILSDAGSSGISIIDKSDFLESAKQNAAWDYVESGLIESMGEFARVSGFFDVKRETITVKRLNAAFEKLKAGDYGIKLGPLEIITRVIDDNDWIDLWKKHFKPITIGNVVIMPEWLTTPPLTLPAGDVGHPSTEGNLSAVNFATGHPIPITSHQSPKIGLAEQFPSRGVPAHTSCSGGVAVILNPGLAFGTGEHETTAGCIELLQSFPLQGKSVIDLGCGSGILGITAAVLGAESVAMIDIDPLAVKASRINVALNAKANQSAMAKITVIEGNLLGKADLKADVIAANLASDLLISAGYEIVAHLNPCGTLILSGIINARADGVINTYESILGENAVKENLHKGEWVALLIRQNMV